MYTFKLRLLSVLILASLLATVSGSHAHARGPVWIFYVDRDATGRNNGASWANAYTLTSVLCPLSSDFRLVRPVSERFQVFSGSGALTAQSIALTRPLAIRGPKGGALRRLLPPAALISGLDNG